AVRFGPRARRPGRGVDLCGLTEPPRCRTLTVCEASRRGAGKRGYRDKRGRGGTAAERSGEAAVPVQEGTCPVDRGEEGYPRRAGGRSGEGAVLIGGPTADRSLLRAGEADALAARRAGPSGCRGLGRRRRARRGRPRPLCPRARRRSRVPPASLRTGPRRGA